MVRSVTRDAQSTPLKEVIMRYKNRSRYHTPILNPLRYDNALSVAVVL